MCRCITEEYGIINFTAHGNYKEKSPLTGLLEPFNAVDLELHRSSTAGLFYLRNAGLIESYMINADYQKTLFLYAAGELMMQVDYPIEDSKDYYDLMNIYCSFLKTTDYHPLPVFIRYVFRLLKILGVPLNNKCSLCGSSEIAAYNIGSQSFICNECGYTGQRFRARTPQSKPNAVPYTYGIDDYRVAETDREYDNSRNLSLGDNTALLITNIGNIGSIDREKITPETIEETKAVMIAHLSSSFHKTFYLKSIQDCSRQFAKS